LDGIGEKREMNTGGSKAEYLLCHETEKFTWSEWNSLSPEEKVE